MDLEDKDFLDFAKFAQEYKLNYIIIVVFAIYLNGIKRNTEDVDIWIEPTNENKSKLLDVFLQLGYTNEELEVIRIQNFEEYFVFSALGHLDLLTHIQKNLLFVECFNESMSHTLTNGSITHFLHINHLRQSKIFAKREIYLRDVILIDDYLKSQKLNSNN